MKMDARLYSSAEMYTSRVTLHRAAVPYSDQVILFNVQPSLYGTYMSLLVVSCFQVLAD